MAKARKSWREKLHDSKDLPKLVELTTEQAKRMGVLPGEKMVVPAPIEVDELMRKVPPGKVVTINDIRAALAKKHGAAVACPMTTGIFARIAAEAAVEAASAGEENTTPYWRTLKAGGALNEKYPGGVEVQKQLLENEGLTVVQKGKRWVVADYEKHLFALP